MNADVKVVSYIDDEGDEIQVALPVNYEVCHQCRGKGTVVHPDVSVVTPEEFEADPDFHEAYMEGRYDVKCPTCSGQRVTAAFVEGAMNKEEKKHYKRFMKAVREVEESLADERRERQHGA
jgi:hypothetical protein